MKTVSFGIANYCVPCQAHCRYCLLSSRGCAAGVDFWDGLTFARRVLGEFSEKRPDLSCYYYIGYCMDTPQLMAYIAFCREYHSPGARFLQMNGFAFRSASELQALMCGIRESGVQLIDLTFYGTEEYHDRFAGRTGDFSFLLQMLAAANQAGLPVNISIPLLRENLDQMMDLRRILSAHQAEKFAYFLPHSKGRGKLLQSQRITKREFDLLPEEIRRSFQTVKHQTEAAWIASGDMPEPEKRNLTLVLTPENLPRFGRMSAEEILSEMETLDDSYLMQIPPARELAKRYGDPKNEQIFRLRDLLLKWQQAYIAESGYKVFDMRDETHHFSVHT